MADSNAQDGQVKIFRAIMFGVTIASVLLSCGITIGALFTRVSQLEKQTDVQVKKVETNTSDIAVNASVLKVVNTKLDYISKGVDELKKSKK